MDPADCRQCLAANDPQNRRRCSSFSPKPGFRWRRLIEVLTDPNTGPRRWTTDNHMLIFLARTVGKVLHHHQFRCFWGKQTAFLSERLLLISNFPDLQVWEGEFRPVFAQRILHLHIFLSRCFSPPYCTKPILRQACRDYRDSEPGKEPNGRSR